MLASLINFSARQDSSVLNLSPQPVKAMEFYKNMLTEMYWCNTFCSQQPATHRWTESTANSKSKESGSEGHLALAGVRCPVFSHQVDVREKYPDECTIYLTRINQPYGYHNDYEFMDTCVNMQ